LPAFSPNAAPERFMQLEQRFPLAAPPARVWAAFRDVPLLVECLPGASLTGAEADGAWPLRFDAKLGPIAAGFLGQGRASFDDAARAGRFEGSAADARTQSRVRGVASFRVEAEGETSVVVVGVDYTLTGSIAQFGRGGIVRELANALTVQFAARLAARLPQTSVETPASPATSVASATATATASEATANRPSAAVDAGPLLGLVLRARWRRFVDWLLRRAPA
jgi:uncharacterized protein